MTVLDILVAIIIIYIIVRCKKEKKSYIAWLFNFDSAFIYLFRVTLSLLCFIHIVSRVNWKFVFQILNYKIL